MRGQKLKLPKTYISLSEHQFCLIANSADPEELSHHESTQQGLHFCLSTCLGVSSLNQVNYTNSVQLSLMKEASRCDFDVY